MPLPILNLSPTLRTDPTRTTTLRARYMGEMRRRFATVRALAVKAIVELDVFGLKEPKQFTFHQDLATHDLPEREAFRFATKAGKVEGFNKWFQRQVDQEILTTTVKGDPWTSKYVGSAYKRGSLRAYMDSHPEAMGESLGFYKGRREQFLESAFNRPERLDKLRLLYTRSYEDLKGITSAMSQRIGRTVADGLSHGLNPSTIARTLVKEVNGITRGRAMTMARTEVINAHAEGQLDSFEEMGVKELKVMAEWSTAGDDRVCPQCEELEGVVMTVDEARGLIPRHPNCRCAWIPANVGEIEKGKRFWTKSDKTRRVHKSLMKGLPKRTRGGMKVPQTVREAKRRSTWPGKDLKPVEPPKGVDLAPPVVPKPKTPVKPKPKAAPKSPLLPKPKPPPKVRTFKTEGYEVQVTDAAAEDLKVKRIYHEHNTRAEVQKVIGSYEKSYARKLTKAESRQIEMYSDIGSGLNEGLREGTVLDAADKEMLKRLDSAIGKSSFPKSMTVERTLVVPEGADFTPLRGKTIVDKAFQSASMEVGQYEDLARGYAAQCEEWGMGKQKLVKIRVAVEKGTPAAPIHTVGEAGGIQSTSEVILPRNAPLHVRSVYSDKSGNTIVEAMYNRKPAPK